ncbi:MAG: hypothetical protein ACSHX6_12395 [Akkermansiaceae bacterium]
MAEKLCKIRKAVQPVASSMSAEEKRAQVICNTKHLKTGQKDEKKSAKAY